MDHNYEKINLIILLKFNFKIGLLDIKIKLITIKNYNTYNRDVLCKTDHLT